MKQKQNRREFIRTTSTGIIGIGITSAYMSSIPEAHGAAAKVKVAVVRNERAISNRNVCDQKQAALMLEKALFTVTDKTKPEEVWSYLGVTKDDIVGIKVNCNSANFRLYVHPELVYALTDSLSSVVKPNNIIIYERYTPELSRAGFRVNKNGSGVRCFGTDEGGGFHPQEGLTRIVTDTCTKIINIPSLKTFGGEFAGSLFLKNHIGTLPPNQMSRCHGNTKFITNVCSQPSIKNKTVLAVCDGLRGTYRKSEPWYWSGIIVSRDQIAAEYEALQIINEKLIMEKEKALETPSYVKLAETAYKLGTCDPGKIALVKTVL